MWWYRFSGVKLDRRLIGWAESGDLLGRGKARVAIRWSLSAGFC